ncbi:MAG TPA: adaptor protein MecA [Acetivibrio sp.]|mgnify:CR=1 FL=1|uniref:adaptor protein MecA n=1 Tax=Acetivibrio sp. TaxID=1872092 RepID=UPI002CD2A55D|nr:adaptor protein MecA [Acetivibrio sp.]HOM01810.1 adaptor protein MecA [Acetivibrio sp.]
MKIERINENKIKVTISIDDLLERNIDLDTINYNTPAAQELFWDMMEQAEMQFGFDASDSQICVEAIPDSEEGFVIIITKLDEDGEFESIQKYIKNRFKRSDLRVKRKNCRVSSSVIMYFFSNFDDLCLLCRKLTHIYSGESTLYRLKGVYYLMLTKNSWSVENLKSFEHILNEFGTKVINTNFYEGYLNEYGEKIIEYNAVETINDYF